jgi:hypothetical protein
VEEEGLIDTLHTLRRQDAETLLNIVETISRDEVSEVRTQADLSRDSIRFGRRFESP